MQDDAFKMADKHTGSGRRRVKPASLRGTGGKSGVETKIRVIARVSR